jgi:hypothetical protein
MIAMRYAQRFSSFFFFSDELDRITSGEWNSLCVVFQVVLFAHTSATHTHTRPSRLVVSVSCRRHCVMFHLVVFPTFFIQTQS